VDLGEVEVKGRSGIERIYNLIGSRREPAAGGTAT
jgi:hypothetical protein